MAFAVALPYAINRIVRSNVLADTRLSPENEQFWSNEIVGGGAVQIYKDHYLYTCSNLEDVSTSCGRLSHAKNDTYR